MVLASWYSHHVCSPPLEWGLDLVTYFKRWYYHRRYRMPLLKLGNGKTVVFDSSPLSVCITCPGRKPAAELWGHGMERPTGVVLEANPLRPANSHLSDIMDSNNFFLIVRSSHIWLVEVPSSWGLYPFDMSLPVFEYFLSFWFTLYFSCPRPGIGCLSKVSFSGECHSETKLWPLGSLSATGISLLIDPFSGQS